MQLAGTNFSKLRLLIYLSMGHFLLELWASNKLRGLTQTQPTSKLLREKMQRGLKLPIIFGANLVISNITTLCATHWRSRMVMSLKTN